MLKKTKIFIYVSFFIGLIGIFLGFVINPFFYFIGAIWVLVAIGASFRKEESVDSLIKQTDDLLVDLRNSDPYTAPNTKLTQFTNSWIKRLNDLMQLGINQGELPNTQLITKRLVSELGRDSRAHYDNTRNVLRFKESTINSGFFGDALGEEVGHFFRQKLFPKSKDGSVKEFFGFLGRKALYQNSGNKKEPLFPEGEPSWKAKTGDLIGHKGLEGYDSARHHHIGYSYAKRVDTSKIHNWKKLFSMPDKEVRRRFFTPNPDYSGL